MVQCSVFSMGDSLSFIARIKRGNYTESDVSQFYIQARSDHGPFIREVGDFIAHPRRDKGASFNYVIGVYSQFAFFQRYQSRSNTASGINPAGPCEWWMKPYFERKLESYSSTELLKHLGKNKAALKAEILSWFPPKEKFPLSIHARNPFDLFDIAHFFSGSLGGPAVFMADQTKKELRIAFKAYDISHHIVDDFLVATAIILNGKTVELACGVTATLSIRVSTDRKAKIEPAPPELRSMGEFAAIYQPDGPLEVLISTTTPKDHGLVDIGLTLLNTEIDTERYFDRSLVEVETINSRALNLKVPLQFEAFRKPQVTAL